MLRKLSILINKADLISFDIFDVIDVRKIYAHRSAFGLAGKADAHVFYFSDQ